MDIRKGDKVKFLNEKGGGIVVNIIGNNQAIIQIEDGFEIPVLLSHLIKTESSNVKEPEIIKDDYKSTQIKDTNISDKSQNPVLQKVPVIIREVVKPIFAIVSASGKKDKNHMQCDLYLLNDSDYIIYYVVSFEKYNQLKLLEKGDLEPETTLNLGSFNLVELLTFQAIIVDILMYSESEYKVQLPIHYRINLKTQNLFLQTNYKETDYFDEPAIIFDLLSKGTSEKIAIEEKIVIDKGDNRGKKKPLKNVELKDSDVEEVDLHIEEIIDNEASLSNGEMLKIQMARFTTSLEGAIKGKTRKIVFIHGVGNGKLRYELCKALDTKYPDLQYQDASFAEYGYGATMVIIKKK